MPEAAAGFIPARYGATRFPGKLLAELGGEPVLVHVIRNARRAERLVRTIVATDDARIAGAARAAGAEVFMSRLAHETGTDRIGEAARELGLIGGAVVNLQGDEPLLGPDAIDACVDALGDDPGADIGTLATRCPPEHQAEPGVVKVAIGRSGRALYFSRALIPWSDRDGERHRHIGIYAFRPGALARYLALPRGDLERRERLEQLRALEGGMTIAVRTGPFPAIGIDTPEDLERARALWPRGSA